MTNPFDTPEAYEKLLEETFNEIATTGPTESFGNDEFGRFYLLVGPGERSRLAWIDEEHLPYVIESTTRDGHDRMWSRLHADYVDWCGKVGHD